MKKTVLVTGSSRGIGRATARLFAQEGWQTVIHYKQAEKEAFSLLEELRADGGKAIALQADITKRQAVERLFSKAEEQFGAVDVLVNNAGIARQKLFTDMTDEDWKSMMAVHLDGLFYCCRRAVPAMLQKGSGCIVNVSSIWGITGASCEVAYSAAKAGVIGFTKALAKELGPSGIRVNCVAPGVIDTDMNAGLCQRDREALQDSTPLGCMGTPEDAARSIFFLASEGAKFITGQVLSPNGGFVI